VDETGEALQIIHPRPAHAACTQSQEAKQRHRADRSPNRKPPHPLHRARTAPNCHRPAPTAGKPAWLIDEYANKRFTLVWKMAGRLPSTMVKAAATSSAVLHGPGNRRNRSTVECLDRAGQHHKPRGLGADGKVMPPPALARLDKRPAPRCWNGAAATLKPRPASSSAAPNSSGHGIGIGLFQRCGDACKAEAARHAVKPCDAIDAGCPCS